MALKIPVPNEKTFTVKVDEGEFSVTFVQATMAQEMERARMFSERRNEYREGETSYIEIVKLDLSELQALDVYLTLVECDIQDTNGKRLFRKNMGRQDFIVSWGKLPRKWAMAMHQKCLEVNVDWGFSTAETEESPATPVVQSEEKA